MLLYDASGPLDIPLREKFIYDNNPILFYQINEIFETTVI